MEMTHAGVCEELQPMGRTHVGEVLGELSPMGETPGAREECEESSSEEEGVAEPTCDELTTTLILHPPALPGGRRQRKLGVK